MFVSGVSDPLDSAYRLELGLEALRAKRIERHGPLLYFTTGMFRAVSSTNLLVAVNAGRLRVEPHHAGLRVSYSLEFVQMFWISSIMVLGFFGPFVLSSSNLTWGQGALILFGFWLWLFGGNVLITVSRFPSWVRRTAAGIPEQ